MVKKQVNCVKYCCAGAEYPFIRSISTIFALKWLHHVWRAEHHQMSLAVTGSDQYAQSSLIWPCSLPFSWPALQSRERLHNMLKVANLGWNNSSDTALMAFSGISYIATQWYKLIGIILIYPLLELLINNKSTINVTDTHSWWKLSGQWCRMKFYARIQQMTQLCVV